MGFLAQLEPLIRDLGSEDYDVRGRATAALMDLGREAVPALVRAAEMSADPEVRVRSELVLERLLGVHVDIRLEPHTNRLRFRVVNEKRRAVGFVSEACSCGFFAPIGSELQIITACGQRVRTRFCTHARRKTLRLSIRKIAPGEVACPCERVGDDRDPICLFPEDLELAPGAYRVRLAVDLGDDGVADSGWVELTVPAATEE